MTQGEEKRRDAHGAFAEPSISCVLLNWNGYSDTVTHLQALLAIFHPRPTLIVVDNGSTDNSVAQIRAAYPDVTLIETGKNLGFAGGNNCGIRHAIEAGAEYVWLLNNDTQPHPDALRHMLTLAQSDPRIGAVGSVLCHAGRTDVVQSWGGGRVNLLLGYNHVARSPKPNAWFDYLCAGSLLVRRDALLDVGLLNEAFFLYWEDVDFGFRLRQRGWKLAVAPGSIVQHKGGASSSGNHSAVDRYFTTSGLRFLAAHSSVPWLSPALFVASRLAKRTLHGQPRRASAVVAGLRDYLAVRHQRGRQASRPPAA